MMMVILSLRLDAPSVIKKGLFFRGIITGGGPDITGFLGTVCHHHKCHNHYSSYLQFHIISCLTGYFAPDQHNQRNKQQPTHIVGHTTSQKAATSTCPNSPGRQSFCSDTIPNILSSSSANPYEQPSPLHPSSLNSPIAPGSLSTSSYTKNSGSTLVTDDNDISEDGSEAEKASSKNLGDPLLPLKSSQILTKWIGAMEKSAMALYVQEVEDVNFKGKTADKLCFYQKFKKGHDSFFECCEASGFGWDEARCEVIALNEVWVQFLVVSVDLMFMIIIIIVFSNLKRLAMFYYQPHLNAHCFQNQLLWKEKRCQ
ncbi:uncharacterized protein VP01_715g10 [Puccinia sorghi]|uniref:Myb/SANT-like domain-containing protein n=1 Tax=Puccinia sorghi TaxID=27349 RepID=A0A0L6UDD0_9BASI|nr:uncharacterized protein VP01_715g10 [Puccinia sorghi]